MLEGPLLLPILFFVVALLYSSVGHGGASGYLALLSFLSLPASEMSTTALTLNLLVSGIAAWSFFRAGHLTARLTWPFVVASVPAAFGGGLMRVSGTPYYLCLAVVLLIAALRLSMRSPQAREASLRPPPVAVAVPAGGVLGIVSGVVGVGGGIFLSPLMMLMGWADAKKTSAASSVFILVNSAAGLAGRYASQTLSYGDLWPLVVASGAGALVGSHYGANVLSGLTLRRLLAGVLVVAALKLFRQVL